MKSFHDLKFDKHPNWPGVQALLFFDNGYCVSVIRSPYSYGGMDDLYELAVLKGGEEQYDLCYGTPVTDDVLGSLSEEDVSKAMAEVQALPSPEVLQ